MASILEEARRLTVSGFNILPTRRGKKFPAVDWKKYQHERTDTMVESWWGAGSGFVGIFALCGAISGLVVLDCDSAEADELWHKLIGPEMDATACVKTRKGHHYWFMIEADQAFPSWAHHEGVVSFDVKCEGGGVMCPPSPHPDGGFYEWVRPPEATLSAPSWLLGGAASLPTLLSGQSPETAHEAPDPVNPATPSLLSHLLTNPPKGEGGRNDWLIKVAGHYAHIIPYADAYRVVVLEANEKLSPPLDKSEAVKTSDSAWNMEKAKGLGTIEALQERGVVAIDSNPTDGNGWLVGAGSTILCPAIIMDGDNKKTEAMLPWADFNIVVVGIVDSGEGFDYLVHLVTTHGVIECVLKGSTLGRLNELLVWLAERRATVIPPDGDQHKRAGIAARLTRYVKSQAAKSYRLTRVLGWDEESGAFITHEGTIRNDSEDVGEFEDVRPSLDLATSGWAPYRYGFAATKADAQGVLREVMTFHDEVVCSVYGAWWAASFLKPHIMKRAALFPFMALEAPSGSGKSTGFFAAMVQMSGNTEGHGQYTAPSLRDRAATHNAGLVWIDDVTDLSDVLDLIRQATSGGSRSKKSLDRHDIETIKLVSPIALSGEGIAGLAEEKALGDRAIKLSVPPPDGRMSMHDPTRSQWDDVTALQMQWRNDFTQLSGWYVAMALECVEMIEEWGNLRPKGGVARFADTMTIVRLGARVLHHMMGNKSLVTLVVDDWVEQQMVAYDPDANMLTNSILPWALRQDDHVRRGPAGSPMIYVDEGGRIYYHEQKLSDSWNKQHHISDRQRQLATLDSLREQRERLGVKGSGKQVRPAGKVGPQVRYHVLPFEISERILDAGGFDLAADGGA